MAAASQMLIPELVSNAMSSLGLLDNMADVIEQDRRKTLLRARRELGVPVELYDRMDFAGIRFIHQQDGHLHPESRWWMRLYSKDRTEHIDVHVPTIFANDLGAWESILAEAADLLSEHLRNKRA